MATRGAAFKRCSKKVREKGRKRLLSVAGALPRGGGERRTEGKNAESRPRGSSVRPRPAAWRSHRVASRGCRSERKPRYGGDANDPSSSDAGRGRKKGRPRLARRREMVLRRQPLHRHLLERILHRATRGARLHHWREHRGECGRLRATTFRNRGAANPEFTGFHRLPNICGRTTLIATRPFARPFARFLPTHAGVKRVQFPQHTRVIRSRAGAGFESAHASSSSVKMKVSNSLRRRR